MSAPDILLKKNRTVHGVYVSNDAAPVCNGDVQWHYSYTACDNVTTTSWTYTYHLIYSGGLTAPTAVFFTVSSPAEFYAPPRAQALPNACGRTVHGVYVSNDAAPVCNGDVQWHYSYTACDNVTTTSSTYTYHVIYSGGLTAPTAGSSTVSCPAESQAAPGAPDILDACGRTVHGVYVSNDAAPVCNGDVQWHYS